MIDFEMNAHDDQTRKQSIFGQMFFVNPDLKLNPLGGELEI